MKRLVNILSIFAGLISIAAVGNAFSHDSTWNIAIKTILLSEGFILIINYIFFKKATLWNS